MKIVKREFELEEIFPTTYYVQVQAKEKITGLVRLFEKRFFNRRDFTDKDLEDAVYKFARKYLENFLYSSDYEVIPFKSRKFHFTKHGNKYYSNELLDLNGNLKTSLKETKDGDD